MRASCLAGCAPCHTLALQLRMHQCINSDSALRVFTCSTQFHVVQWPALAPSLTSLVWHDIRKPDGWDVALAHAAALAAQAEPEEGAELFQVGTAVLCCAVLCCAVLCCAVLCCAVLCWLCWLGWAGSIVAVLSPCSPRALASRLCAYRCL